MEHVQRGMKRKWERYYRETNATIGTALILFGTTFMISMSALWPQMYAPILFDSRLSYHLVMDIEDLWTCNKDFQNFVVDEPPTDVALTQFFVFNITNAPDVIQRGYKPYVTEIGPYAYQKLSYKYEIFFNSNDTTKVEFKEFTMLREISDPSTCTRMYHRMARSEAEASDPCTGGACECRNHDEKLTVVNPLFLKMVWEESAPNILAYFSLDVYTTIKSVMENEFVASTKHHLAHKSIGEVYLFRIQMQVHNVLTTMFTNLTNSGYTQQQVADMHINTIPSVNNRVDCGLEEEFSISPCPIYSYDYVHLERENILSRYYGANGLYPNLTWGDSSIADFLDRVPTYKDDNTTSIPSAIHIWYSNRSELNPLDAAIGLPGYLGLGNYMVSTITGNKYLEFNEPRGHSMFNATEGEALLARRASLLAIDAFGANYTIEEYIGSEVLIKSTAQYVSELINDHYSKFQLMAYEEFNSTSNAVPCNIHGHTCIWQWGYVKQQHQYTDFHFTSTDIEYLVSIERKLNTNPTNLQYEGNAIPLYNSYTYCNKVLGAGMTDSCDDLEYSYNDALVTNPAGLMGLLTGLDLVNSTNLQYEYGRLSASESDRYFYLACNLSYLLYEVFPQQTDFHDHYTIRYLNKYRDPDLNHSFSVGNWEEIGWSQWGGGFVSYALTEVRSTYQLTRDGFWYWGALDFWDSLMEYGAWCIKTGFPQAWIYDPYDARDVLYALADNTTEGVNFRQHVIYIGTTFVGDGTEYINEVGDVGELAFTSEANRGDFACDGQTFSTSCDVLNNFITSSSNNAIMVNDIYEACLLLTYSNNPFVVNCEGFETAMTSPQQGIQVTMADVYGHLHPYTKSRGNVLYEMMYSLTMDLKIKSGLWCPNFNGCPYAWGGMFTNVKVRQLLFQGFTEPSVLRYLNMRYNVDGINFRCVSNYEGDCGSEILRCNEDGVYLTLPGGGVREVSYRANNLTQKEEYFAPYYEVIAGTDELIWAYSSNETTRAYALAVRADSSITTIQIRNPFWTAYPAWNTDDIEFQKYYQCQKRTYFGMPNKFSSCVSVLNTGRQYVNESLNQREFFGNETIDYFTPTDTMLGVLHVNGSTHMKHPMSLWDGFQTYNYTYAGRTAGLLYSDLQSPRVFIKDHSISLGLNQEIFIYEWQKNLLIEFPITDGFSFRNFSRVKYVAIRRFQEWEESWAPLRDLGKPSDSYGMPYTIPCDMASLETLSGFPLFVGTPHAYGNELWGGTEFGHVQGYAPREKSQRTFVDYDPITGRNVRQAIRQQVNIRVEKGPLYPNVFSSQDRCIAPTKAFSAYSGYGCFAYVPMIWIDDSRVISNQDFYRVHDHYYSRPGRTMYIEMVGLIVGCVSVFVGLNIVLAEYFHRRNFHRRVYVD